MATCLGWARTEGPLEKEPNQEAASGIADCGQRIGRDGIEHGTNPIRQTGPNTMGVVLSLMSFASLGSNSATLVNLVLDGSCKRGTLTHFLQCHYLLGLLLSGKLSSLKCSKTCNASPLYRFPYITARCEREIIPCACDVSEKDIEH